MGEAVMIFLIVFADEPPTLPAFVPRSAKRPVLHINFPACFYPQLSGLSGA
jgi:hypothetical protein